MLTAAHVVVGAATITVAPVAGAATTHRPVTHGDVVGLDLANDLALVEIEAGLGDRVSRPQISDLQAGAAARIVGGATSGTIDITVERRVSISVEAVRSNDVVRRDGYEFIGRISGGDSGAGVFDDRDGLVAIVFARPVAAADSPRQQISFGTAGPAIARLLDADRRVFACDHDDSIVVDVASARR